MPSKDEIQILMEIIGIIVAACPTVAYGWLYYKTLESLKREGLEKHHGNPNKSIHLNSLTKEELIWWNSNILLSKNQIRSSVFDLEIFSDASTTGWGATCGKEKARGLWNEKDRTRHINYLEIKAAFLALRSFASREVKKQILLRIDNLTALAYLNKMGGIKHKNLNDLTKQI